MMTELHAIAHNLGTKYSNRTKNEVHYLLSKGVDPEAKDENGMTALDIAETRNAGWYFGKMIDSYAIQLRRDMEAEKREEEEKRKQFPLMTVYENDLNMIWERIMEGIYLEADYHHVQKMRKWAEKWDLRHYIHYNKPLEILRYIFYGYLPLGMYSHYRMEKLLLKYENEEAQPKRKRIKNAIFRQARRPESRFNQLPREIVKKILSFALASHLHRYQSIRRIARSWRYH